MSERDLQQLRLVLREAVRASRMPIREMERQLGIGHGNLYRMLDGQLDLRVRHLLALAELLGIPPTDFLELGCPDAVSRAKRRLGDWIGRPSPAIFWIAVYKQGPPQEHSGQTQLWPSHQTHFQPKSHWTLPSHTSQVPSSQLVMATARQ